MKHDFCGNAGRELLPEDSSCRLKQLAEDEYFFISDNVTYAVLRTEDIICLEIEQNYTRIKSRNCKDLCIRRPLYKCEERLPINKFFRANRFCIINLAQVKKIEAHDARHLVVTLTGDKTVVFSREQTLLFRRTKSL